MARIKKGDHLIYTGRYATAADMADLGVAPEFCKDVDPYPPGTAVRFRDYGEKVTVLLDKEPGETEDRYADWPVSEVEKISG